MPVSQMSNFMAETLVSERIEERLSEWPNVMAENLEQIIDNTQERISERIKERTRCALHVIEEIVVNNITILVQRISERTGKHFVRRIMEAIVEVEGVHSARGLGALCKCWAWCGEQRRCLHPHSWLHQASACSMDRRAAGCVGFSLPSFLAVLATVCVTSLS